MAYIVAPSTPHGNGFAGGDIPPPPPSIQPTPPRGRSTRQLAMDLEEKTEMLHEVTVELLQLQEENKRLRMSESELRSLSKELLEHKERANVAEENRVSNERLIFQLDEKQSKIVHLEEERREVEAFLHKTLLEKKAAVTTKDAVAWQLGGLQQIIHKIEAIVESLIKSERLDLDAEDSRLEEQERRSLSLVNDLQELESQRSKDSALPVLLSGLCRQLVVGKYRTLTDVRLARSRTQKDLERSEKVAGELPVLRDSLRNVTQERDDYASKYRQVCEDLRLLERATEADRHTVENLQKEYEAVALEKQSLEHLLSESKRALLDMESAHIDLQSKQTEIESSNQVRASNQERQMASLAIRLQTLQDTTNETRTQLAESDKKYEDLLAEYAKFREESQADYVRLSETTAEILNDAQARVEKSTATSSSNSDEVQAMQVSLTTLQRKHETLVQESKTLSEQEMDIVGLQKESWETLHAKMDHYERLDKEMLTEQQNLQQQITAIQSSLQTDVSGKDARIAELSKDNSFKDDRIAVLEGELASTKAARKRADTRTERLEAEKDELHHTKAAIDRKAKNNSDRVAELERDLVSADKRVVRLKRDVELGEQRIVKLESQLEESQATIDSSYEKVQTLEADLETCKQDLEQSNTDLEVSKKEAKDSKTKVLALQADLSSAENGASDTSTKIATLETDLEESKKEASSAKEKVASLESELEKSRAEQTQASATAKDEITEHKEQLRKYQEIELELDDTRKKLTEVQEDTKALAAAHDEEKLAQEKKHEAEVKRIEEEAVQVSQDLQNVREELRVLQDRVAEHEATIQHKDKALETAMKDQTSNQLKASLAAAEAEVFELKKREAALEQLFEQVRALKREQEQVVAGLKQTQAALDDASDQVAFLVAAEEDEVVTHEDEDWLELVAAAKQTRGSAGIAAAVVVTEAEDAKGESAAPPPTLPKKPDSDVYTSHLNTEHLEKELQQARAKQAANEKALSDLATSNDKMLASLQALSSDSAKSFNELSTAHTTIVEKAFANVDLDARPEQTTTTTTTTTATAATAPSTPAKTAVKTTSAAESTPTHTPGRSKADSSTARECRLCHEYYEVLDLAPHIKECSVRHAKARMAEIRPIAGMVIKEKRPDIVLVSKIVRDGPVWGIPDLKEGDQVMKLNDISITCNRVLLETIQQCQPGDAVDLEWRPRTGASKGSLKTTKIEIGGAGASKEVIRLLRDLLEGKMEHMDYYRKMGLQTSA